MAQDNLPHPNDRTKFFDTKEEAIDWLKQRGGGEVKQRNAGVVYVFGEPVRVWKIVASI